MCSFDCSISASSCENYVAIIVSSMPAVTSVSKSKTSVTSWLTSMRSRLLKSRPAAPRSKGSVSYRSKTGVCPSDEVVLADYNAGDGSRLELSDSRHAEDYELGSVKTEIPAAADGRGTLDESIVYKSMEVHPSMR